ncbi:MAG: hypothetical protein IKZ01_00065 [Anaerotignum sp.]|nr:hypothetical protein [Anaerotignum sp.]
MKNEDKNLRDRIAELEREYGRTSMDLREAREHCMETDLNIILYKTELDRIFHEHKQATIDLYDTMEQVWKLADRRDKVYSSLAHIDRKLTEAFLEGRDEKYIKALRADRKGTMQEINKINATLSDKLEKAGYELYREVE